MARESTGEGWRDEKGRQTSRLSSLLGPGPQEVKTEPPAAHGTEGGRVPSSHMTRVTSLSGSFREPSVDISDL